MEQQELERWVVRVQKTPWKINEELAWLRTSISWRMEPGEAVLYSREGRVPPAIRLGRAERKENPERFE